MARPDVDELASLCTNVCKQLKDQIIDGVLAPGEKLPSESELCKIYGVSRITIRGALQQLCTLGLVETRVGSGSYIKKIDPSLSISSMFPFLLFSKNKDMIKVLEFRKILEKGTIGLAVEKASAQDIQDLEKIYEQMIELKADTKRHAEKDMEFHYRIVRIVDNPVITKIYEMMQDIIASSIVDNVTTFGPEDGIRVHKQLLDLISRKQKDKAEKAMEEIIDQAIRHQIAGTTKAGA